MPVDNGSFEVVGASPGLADGWTVSITATGEVTAVFAGEGGETHSAESFELWLGTFVTEMAGGTLAVFEPDLLPQPTTETFERWLGDPYLTEISGGSAAQFVGALTVEDFEPGWGNDAYLTGVGAGSASFTDDVESWQPGFVTEVGAGSASASFNTPSGPSAVEDFEAVQPDRVYVVDMDTGYFIAVAHDLDEDQKLTTLTTGLRPGGLVENFVYFARVIDADHFQLRKVAGGAPFVVTDVGVGTQSVRADPTVFWPTESETL
ncbi:MAG: hypothetical protein EKK55_24485 [Rhodocyclaceae bacterium]|nr:MAG: hypothetical protein EKK55_24485 [Rhodocyclaceae bacterium]